jgi:hypothetical protein
MVPEPPLIGWVLREWHVAAHNGLPLSKFTDRTRMANSLDAPLANRSRNGVVLAVDAPLANRSRNGVVLAGSAAAMAAMALWNTY